MASLKITKSGKINLAMAKVLEPKSLNCNKFFYLDLDHYLNNLFLIIKNLKALVNFS
jgi:hypothetical protein